MSDSTRASPSFSDSLADPELFLAIDDLELATRALVDSVLIGHHRGAKLGAGTEFSQHRDYRRGDDLRQVNWRLYGRTRRLFVKEVFAESTMTVRLLVDASASMRIGEPISKYRYAAQVAAALALLALRTRDPVGLSVLRETVSTHLGPRANSTQFVDLLAALDQAPNGKCDLIGGMSELVESSRNRGMVVVLSDFVGPETGLRASLAALRDFGHEVVLVQVLAPFEIELPESGDFEFVDPETGHLIKTPVEPIRGRYAVAVKAWRKRLQQSCEELGVHWHSASTRKPMAPLLHDLVESLSR
jgi:uncharacterized protein (DUF58 family)